MSPSARNPLLPNKRYSCWSYSFCSNLFIGRVRNDSSTLKNSVDKAFSRIKEIRRIPTWCLLQQSNSTFTNCPRIFGDFHISDIFVLLFLCWKWKEYSIKISKTIASQLKNPLLTSYRMWLPSTHCPNLLYPHTKEYFSAQNYEGITDTSIQKEYKINFANINHALILAASATTKTSCRSSRTQRGLFAITRHPWMTFVSKTSRRG